MNLSPTTLRNLAIGADVACWVTLAILAVHYINCPL